MSAASGAAGGMDLRKRILLIGSRPPPVTGQSMAFDALLEALAVRGVSHEIVDISPRDASARSVLGGISSARTKEILRALRKAAKKMLPARQVVYLQIAQTWGGFLRDAAFVWLARLFGHRVVAHLHGGNYDGFYARCSLLQRWLVRRTLRRCARIIVLSERLQRMFDFDPALASRLRVVPNGVTMPPEPPPKPHPPLRVAYVSSMIESKGYGDLLEGVVMAWEKGADVEVDFCGAFYSEATADPAAEAAAARERFLDRLSRLDGRARYHGLVDEEKKRELLARAHVLALPTTYPNEGQPIAIIEAMAWGAAVLATPHRAIPDMVEDGVTGSVVPAGDPVAIADRLASLAAEPQRAVRMGAAGRRRAMERYTIGAHVDALLAVLREVD